MEKIFRNIMVEAPDVLMDIAWKELIDATYDAIVRKMTAYELPEEQGLTKEQASEDMYYLLAELENFIDHIGYK